MKGLINFSVKNAIRKGANLGNKKDGVFWVDFRYEKIPRCCFSCGMFGHDEGECESMKEAKEKGETFTPKDLGAWVKALGGGRKVTWPGEDKSKNDGVTKSEGHKVGLVRRNDTESLLEKLASMTMKDIDMQNGKIGVGENASVMVEEDSQMDGVIVGSVENDVYGKVEMGNHVGQGVGGLGNKDLINNDGRKKVEGVKEVSTNKESDLHYLNEVDDGGKPPMLNQKVKMIPKGGKGTKGGVLTWKRVAREKENVVPVTEIKKRLFNDLTNGNDGMEIDDVCIGSGDFTHVLRDPWIPNTFPLTTCVETLNAFPISKVSELINEESGEWDEHFIRFLFGVDMSERILQVPRNRAEMADHWAWMPDSKGIFSIMLSRKGCGSYQFFQDSNALSGVWLKSTTTWEEMARSGNLGTDVEKWEGRIKWVKPASPCFKLNCDAAVRAGFGGAIGGVIRNSEGVVVAAYAVPVKNTLDIHRLEALAIYKGVEVGRGLGIQQLEVESDAKMVVDCLNANGNQASLLNSLCSNILLFCACFSLIDVLKHDFYQ
ncbi:cysteine desulfurase mitochondrial-like [Senna tora]|uniref:Cysteine desulfurase mitochondrial-like n=1 Tax=Senna tora TaxID=362788 RepID=A0A834TQT8_9FABA|nr:cysteine desulfurase mitochondrial-like [Senna tora]